MVGKDGTMREIEPPQFGPTGKQLILNNKGEPVEIEGTLGSVSTQTPFFFDKNGQVIQGARPFIRPDLGAFNPGLIVQKFMISGKPIFLDSTGNMVDVEQGQADGGSVLMAQNESLVYYLVMVNDVYAYFLTGTKTLPVDGGISPTPTQFPTTQGELDKIIAFAAAHSKTFPDPEALTIEIKSAWVEAAGLPNLSSYITMNATIPTYDTDQIAHPGRWVRNGRKTALLAMVSMHVVGSTAGHPEMIWATFDHKDNAPNGTYRYLTSANIVQSVNPDFSKAYLFCPAFPNTSQLNKPHMHQDQGNLDDIEAATGFMISPSNTIRGNAWGAALDVSPNPVFTSLNPLVPPARANSELISINNNVRGMLNSLDVRNNYIMTGATWTIDGVGFNENFGNPGNPGIVSGRAVGTSQMANVTMETYQQQLDATGLRTTFNQVSNNCFSCHGSNKVDVSHIFFTPGAPTHGIKKLF
jgi:hypothetical protein